MHKKIYIYIYIIYIYLEHDHFERNIKEHPFICCRKLGPQRRPWGEGLVGRARAGTETLIICCILGGSSQLVSG